MLPRRFLESAFVVAVIPALLLIMPGQAMPAAEAQASGAIIGGTKPPPAGGLGIFVYSGGTFAQLLAASECPSTSARFFHHTPDGGFAVWIPGTLLRQVNERMMARFPGDHIPPGTIFIASCGATTIALGDTIDIRGGGASSSAAGVTITSPGAYEISGTLLDGTVEVHAPGGTVELILAGADITNLDGPAIYFANATRGLVTVTSGTTNTLTDGGTSELDAVLYAAIPLTIRGAGDLTVTANNLEGISSTMDINVEGGNIRVFAIEDGLNASTDGVSSINISGGSLYVQSLTGDGIDSNGTLTISGGTVTALGSLGDLSGGVDADGAFTINGGTLIATGAKIPPPAIDSRQGSILAVLGGVRAANTPMSIEASGVQLLTFAPAIDYDRVFFSSSSIARGVAYHVYVDGAAAGTVTTESRVY